MRNAWSTLADSSPRTHSLSSVQRARKNVLAEVEREKAMAQRQQQGDESDGIVLWVR